MRNYSANHDDAWDSFPAKTFNPWPQIVQFFATADKRNIGKPEAEDGDHPHEILNESIVVADTVADAASVGSDAGSSDTGC